MSNNDVLTIESHCQGSCWMLTLISTGILTVEIWFWNN